MKAEGTGGSRKSTLLSPSNPLAERNWRELVEGEKRFPKRDSIGIYSSDFNKKIFVYQAINDYTEEELVGAIGEFETMIRQLYNDMQK